MEQKYEVHIVSTTPNDETGKGYWHAKIRSWVDIIITYPEAKIIAGDQVLDLYVYKVYDALPDVIGTNASEVWVRAIASSNPDHELPLISYNDIQYIIDNKVNYIEMEMDTWAGVLPEQPEGKGWTVKAALGLAAVLVKPKTINGFIHIIRQPEPDAFDEGIAQMEDIERKVYNQDTHGKEI